MDGETVSAVTALILAEKAVTAGWRSWRGKRKDAAEDRKLEAEAKTAEAAAKTAEIASEAAEADLSSTSAEHVIEGADLVVKLMADHVKRQEATLKATEQRAAEREQAFIAGAKVAEESCTARIEEVAAHFQERDEACQKRIVEVSTEARERINEVSLDAEKSRSLIDILMRRLEALEQYSPVPR